MSLVVPSLSAEKLVGAADKPRVTVTGADADNNLFREQAVVLGLQGRDCTYESRYRVQPGSSLMVEIPSTRGSEQTWRAAAIVEAISAVGPGQNLFHVTLVLGRAHESLVVGGAIQAVVEPPRLVAVAPTPSPVPACVVAASQAKVAAAPERVLPKDGSGTMISSSPATPAAPAGAAALAQARSTVAEAALNEEALRKILAEGESAQIERITGALRPMIASLVREAVTSESARQMRELTGLLSHEVDRAIQAPIGELAQYAKALPVMNEQCVREMVGRAIEQQSVRTTALLRPVIEEMVRATVTSESERQSRELRSDLSREIENAIQEPLGVMAQYAQTLPTVSEETVRQMIGQASELQFERATAAIQPMIGKILRSAIAAEYERQTLQLKKDIFEEVGKAVQGPVALQMAAMLDSALGTRMAQRAQAPSPISGETVEKMAQRVAEHPKLAASIDALVKSATEKWFEAARVTQEQEIDSAQTIHRDVYIKEIMHRLQAEPDSVGREMRDVLESRMSEPSSVETTPLIRSLSAAGANDPQLRELLRVTGAQLEEEIQAALHRVFGSR